MKKILWISYCVPYDGVAHAGGKVHNFYIKELARENYDISLLTFSHYDELKKIDLIEYGINNKIIVHHNTLGSKLFWGMLSNLRGINMFSGYAELVTPFVEYHLRKAIKHLDTWNEKPDVIILQWTQIVLFIDLIKKIFPNIPVICIEEDVSFLSYERKIKNSKNIAIKIIKNGQYNRLKGKELHALSMTDYIITSNKKDKAILEQCNIRKSIWTWTPYFKKYTDFLNTGESKNVIFYGAMNREENYKSVIWFIEKVWGYIDDNDAKLYIIGNNPNKKLYEYACDDVIITGFVDDVSRFFMNACCMVAPLLLGAGIKIKILEAMSAGIPVLTNDIGIEGVFAKPDIDYYHCNTAKDYIAKLNEIMDGFSNRDIIGRNAQYFITQNYDYNKTAKEFLELIEKI